MHHICCFGKQIVDSVNNCLLPASSRPTFLFSFLCTRWICKQTTLQSFCCDDLECKNPQHQNLPMGACKRSFIMTNILNNNPSLNSSRNNSICTRANSISQGAHAKRIAQLLLSPTGSLFPSNDCSSCPPRRESTISEMVCVCFSSHLFSFHDFFLFYVS
jgi:hypothetical protein